MSKFPTPNHLSVSFQVNPLFLDEIDDRLIDVISENVRSLTIESISMNVTNAHYLPPDRSGILAGWPLFASLAIDVMRQKIGLRNVSVPPLSGTPGDFVQSLLRIIANDDSISTTKKPSSLLATIGLLEVGILQGRITVPTSRDNTFDLEYSDGKMTLPVQRDSSMVEEATPLYLMLRNLIQSNDLLVIDEPEAHLHPENQRRMARVLARIATAGVTVIAPTHSSTIIHQISNLVRASQLTESERADLGLEESDRISPEDVGIYAFHPTDNGTVIEEVVYDPEFGYPEEQFLEVADDLSRESYWIDSKMSPIMT